MPIAFAAANPQLALFPQSNRLKPKAKLNNRFRSVKTPKTLPDRRRSQKLKENS